LFRIAEALTFREVEIVTTLDEIFSTTGAKLAIGRGVTGAGSTRTGGGVRSSCSGAGTRVAASCA
jgi:hypothetical protein